MLKRLAALLGLAVVAALAVLGFTAARRYVTPPELVVTLPERAGAGAPFELLLTASKPVEYRLEYAGLTLAQAAREWRVSLVGEEGPTPLRVVAVDAAGNEVEREATVTGVPRLRHEVTLPAELVGGDPLGIHAAWDPGAASVVEAHVDVAGQPVRTVLGPDGLTAITHVPLGAPEGELGVTVTVIDEFGRVAQERGRVKVLPDPRPVEVLALAPEVLAIRTPEAYELEAAMTERLWNEVRSEQLWTEAFLLPVEGRYTSSFGDPRRYEPGGPVSYHLGTDIGLPTGTPVRSTNDGVVVVAGDYPIKGGFVAVDHGRGVVSMYMHLSMILAEEGQPVRRGDLIGEVGSTGLSTGPHLHWEMRVDGEATNPLAWVDKVLP